MKTCAIIYAYIVAVATVVNLGHAADCQEPQFRVDCGHLGTDKSSCESSGCCWAPVDPNPSNKPWCFKSSSGPSPSPSPPSPGPIPPSKCSLAHNTSTTPPFSDAEVATMRKFFLANLDIDGNGGVVASPDHDTGPGGDYFFHWARDGALSMAALQRTAGSFGDVKEKLSSYAKWVAARHTDVDPNGIDTLVEPKFLLPNGGVFDKGWCRPQNDGPGLRASTLMAYGDALAAEGDTAAAAALWPTISTDLDWVAANWTAQGCDLWEEIRSDDFFWNRYTMRAALLKGAAFATTQGVGDAARAKTYGDAGKAVEATLAAHWTGDFIFETQSQGRLKDAAVICALNDGYLGDDVFRPSGKEAAGTIATLNALFCDSFDMNRNDAANGVPGILYGRYEGDTYDGGNPWILLSAALAELLFNAAAQVRHANANLNLSSSSTATAEAAVGSEALALWRRALDLSSSNGEDDIDAFSAVELADAMAGAGDGVLLRIRAHVKDDGFHLAEQLDRETGKATSATDLTWSYATVLKAMHARPRAWGVAHDAEQDV